MADYLSRMIARHLGLSEVVRPVLPSRFAPLEKESSESSVPAGWNETGQNLAPHPSQTDESSVRFSESEEPSAILGHRVFRLTSLAETREEGGAERKKELPAAPLAEENRFASDGRRKSEATEEHPAFPKTAGPRDLPPELQESEKPGTLRPLRSPETDSPRAPKASPEGKPASPVPDKALSVRPRVLRTIRSEDPGQRPQISSRDFAAGLRPDNSEPPVIKVRIGRVEVRAVMPSAPPPRREAPQRRPHLSLEDYLRHREGGRS